MNEKGLQILEQYDIQLQRSFGGRGSLMLETDQGLKLLKEFAGSRHKLPLEQRILKRLEEQGVTVTSQERDSIRDVSELYYSGLSAEDLDDAIDISESLSEDVTTYQSAIATVKANQESRLEKRLHQIIAHTMGQEA